MHDSCIDRNISPNCIYPDVRAMYIIICFACIVGNCSHSHDTEVISALFTYVLMVCPSCRSRDPAHAQSSVYSNGAVLRNEFENVAGGDC